MALQSDSNLRLNIINEDGSKKQGMLKLQEQNCNIVLSFYPEIDSPNPAIKTKRIAQVPDHVFHLCDFTMIRVNPKDRLSITLEAPRSKCQLLLLNEQDAVYLFRFISSNVKLIQTECNPYIYLFSPLDNDLQEFSSTVLPQMKPHASYAVLQRNRYPNMVFTLDQNSQEFTKDDFMKLFDESGKIESQEFPKIIFNKNINKEILGEIWEFLTIPSFTTMTSDERKLKKQENLDSFKSIKKIWKSTSSRQWKYFVELRYLVDLIEKDISNNKELFNHFEHPECVQKIAFEILLSLSYWKWDNAFYVNGFVIFLMPILNGFIKDAKTDVVINFKDEEVSIDEMESSIFWCFDSFYQSNNLYESIHPEKQPILRNLMNEIGEILNQYFPDIRQILDRKHVFSLDFLLDDCRLWFTNDFGKDDIEKLWLSCLSFKDASSFFKVFIVSIIYSLAPEIESYCVLSTKEFNHSFQVTKKEKSDICLFLHNAEAFNHLLELQKSSTAN